MRGGEGRMEGWVGGTGDEDGCGDLARRGGRSVSLKRLDDLLACLRSKVIKFAIV